MVRIHFPPASGQQQTVQDRIDLHFRVIICSVSHFVASASAELRLPIPTPDINNVVVVNDGFKSDQ